MKSLARTGQFAAIFSLLVAQMILLTAASGSPRAIRVTRSKPCKDRKVEPIPPRPKNVTSLTFGAFVYPKTDLLDIMGVLRVFGERVSKYPEFNTTIVLIGESMDPVLSDQQVKIWPDATIENAPPLDYFLLPGGHGTADVIANKQLMELVDRRIKEARWCLTVCTGAAILAATGQADGRYMTTNKLAWNTFIEYGPKVKWLKRARWVQDGKFISSSGVSAGIDMAFSVVAQLYGEKLAQQFADWIEYTRHTDADEDPFADLYPDNRDAPTGSLPTPTPTH